MSDLRDLHDPDAVAPFGTVVAEPEAATTPAATTTDAEPGSVDSSGGPVVADGRQSLIKLVALVALVVVLALAMHAVNLLIVIVALIVMIMLHELGHFATAKWSGMKVTEYFLGFGPRVWSFRRGETEYGVKAIPAGGYVRIIGMANTEEVDPADEARTYRAKPFHNRLAVGLAGSFMHFVMAFALIWGMLMFVGAPNSRAVSVGALSAVTGGVDPARTAGIRPGDVFVSVDGKAITSMNQLTGTISSHAGRPVTVVVDRRGTRHTVTVTPHALTTTAPGGKQVTVGRIGVVIENPLTPVGPIAAARQSGVDIGQVVSGSIAAVGQRFSPSGLEQYYHQLTNAKAAQQASQSGQRIQSIVGAVRTATQGAAAGAWQLTAVLVSIIIFVGLLNLLPMLPLDGGHVAIAIYERIRSRPGRPYRADVAKLAPVAYAFVLFLVVIVVSSFYLDVTHPIVNPFK